MTQKFYHNPINDELEYMPGFDENSTKADGQPYTVDDLVALTLVFEG